jgi:3-hydroxyacyl-CoA dehydrogenase
MTSNPTPTNEEERALRYLTEAEQQSSNVPGLYGVAPRPVERVAVIGAGTMGSGIAVSLANAGLTVDLLEQNPEATAAGANRVKGLYEKLVKRGRLTKVEAASRIDLIRASDDWGPVVEADLVIEAAFEDMAVKQEIFGRLDTLARPGAVLASNTSYLDVNAIADMTSRPADVLGLHFFSPAHLMRVLEVVRTDRTAPEVLATGLALGRRIGKLPIVAGVCDGFIGNRIFAVYRRHAEYLLEDGASPQEIDDALRSYGFAMGPFAVSDMSGLDIAWAMRKRRAATRDPAERYVSIPDRLCEAGRLGRKVGRGWYDYLDGKAHPAPEVEAIIAGERDRVGEPAIRPTPQQIQRRILAVMVNEAARVLAEGVSLRPSDIDLVLVNGYGFPSVKGGPLYQADSIGLAKVLADVEEAARCGGAGSEPAQLLVELAYTGSSFAQWRSRWRA